jgi:anti-sigma factor RsiW
VDCHEVATWLVLPPEDPGDRAALKAHLQSCVSCAARAQHMAHLDDLLGSTLVAEPSAQLSQRLVALARAAARPAPQTVAAPAAARVPRTAATVTTIPERIQTRRPIGWTERLVGLGFAALLTVALWNLLGLSPLLTAVTLAWGVVVSVQAILTSPAWTLLADPSETFRPLISVTAALLLVWLLLHESARRPGRLPRRLSF